MKRCLCAAVFALAIVGCGEDQSEYEPAVIQDGSFFKYSKESFPKLYSKWGDDGVNKIMRLERAAAYKVSESKGGCDAIHTSALSENKSSKEEIVIYVDCNNGTRVYVSERELSI